MTKRRSPDRGDPSFAKWAPAEAVSRWHEYRGLLPGYASDDPRRDGPDMLARLLTWQDMWRVWDVIGSATPTMPNGLPGHIGDISMHEIFAATTTAAYAGPYGEARFPPSVHDEWMKKVTAHAVELARLLAGTQLDLELMRKLDLFRHDVGHLSWLRFSHILSNVPSIAQRRGLLRQRGVAQRGAGPLVSIPRNLRR